MYIPEIRKKKKILFTPFKIGQGKGKETKISSENWTHKIVVDVDRAESLKVLKKRIKKVYNVPQDSYFFVTIKNDTIVRMYSDMDSFNTIK